MDAATLQFRLDLQISRHCHRRTLALHPTGFWMMGQSLDTRKKRPVVVAVVPTPQGPTVRAKAEKREPEGRDVVDIVYGHPLAPHVHGNGPNPFDRNAGAVGKGDVLVVDLPVADEGIK